MLSMFLEPDIVLPLQLRYPPAARGEERLMLAVLADALAGFQKHAFARDTRGRRVFREAEAWIHCRDRRWPFSFENICDVLSIDAGYVRWQLYCWRGRQPAGRGRSIGSVGVDRGPAQPRALSTYRIGRALP